MYHMKYGKQVSYEANFGGAEYEVPEDELKRFADIFTIDSTEY